MATTNLKKNANGYSYKYTDLASIHDYLESQGITYWQYIETVDGVDYMMTVPIVDGKEKTPRRGCRLVDAKLQGKANAAQEQGSALTYARRYSLLMAFGLATTDDDAKIMTSYEPTQEGRKAEAVDRKGMLQEIKKLIAQRGTTEEAILEQGRRASWDEMPTSQMQSCITFLTDDKNWRK